MSADDYMPDMARSALLADVGGPGYLTATIVDTCGATYFVLARIDLIGDQTARFDATCAHVGHEQHDPLPIEVVRRIAIASRRHLDPGTS